MIKAIIFDLGGVLFTNGTKKFIETISHKYNVDKEKVKDVMDGEIGSLYREAKISRDEFWQRCLDELQITADIDKLEEEWINGYELIEGTRDIIQELSKKYKVYFLSDNVKERVDKVNEKYNFLNWFEDGVFSHEAGVRKPDQEIYKLALAKTGVESDEAVYIDDKPDFLIPAKEMGMLTFAFETPEKLREELKNNNLLD
ncbi:MAG TPA: HAD family phosphatase [Candidatus Saccharimonadales bacterium]|nr:HAD family phosphatase [Candidatus Saccharimonadales bacterium]